MTSTDTLITEVKNSLKQYDSANLIDDLAIIDWIYKAMRRFGNLLTTKHETFITVVDGKAWLPKNFESLRYASKWDRHHVETPVAQDILQKSYFWKERTEKSTAWNVCKDCEKSYSEQTIVEKVFFHDQPVNFHYCHPQKLRLSRHTNKDMYERGCKNLTEDSPYEITINNNIVYTNFKEGEIFIKYYGFELDEQNKPYIPQTPQERLETYLTYHIKRKIFENLWLNGDDENIQNKIQYLLAQEQAEFNLALTDIKAATLTIKGMLNMVHLNKQRTRVFEY